MLMSPSLKSTSSIAPAAALTLQPPSPTPYPCTMAAECRRFPIPTHSHDWPHFILRAPTQMPVAKGPRGDFFFFNFHSILSWPEMLASLLLGPRVIRRVIWWTGLDNGGPAINWCQACVDRRKRGVRRGQSAGGGQIVTLGDSVMWPRGKRLGWVGGEMDLGGGGGGCARHFISVPAGQCYKRILPHRPLSPQPLLPQLCATASVPLNNPTTSISSHPFSFCAISSSFVSTRFLAPPLFKARTG